MRRGPCLAFAAIVASAVTVLIGACAPSYPTCYRGEHRACACEPSSNAPFTTGYQACNVTEDGFQACVCDGRTPGVDGGRDASGIDARPDTSGPADGTYLGSCESTSCRETGALCFPFESKGKRCTKACKLDTECPPPSPGCNPKSVCKLP